MLFWTDGEGFVLGPMRKVVLNRELCDGSADCITACPYDCIEMVGKYPLVHEERCTQCGACARVCPREALYVERPKRRRVGNTSVETVSGR
jgi:ferredoxin